MDTFEQYTNETMEMVNRNAIQKRNEALAKSRKEERQKIRQKKQQNKERIKKQAIASILLITTITGSIMLTNHFTSKKYEDNNTIISTATAENIIDEKINYYEKLMNMNADNNNAIEIMVGRDFSSPKYEPTVYYKEDNLAKHIVEAAKISETEARCVIIAAFRIINEPYRNQTIGMALSKANAMQEEEANYKIPKDAQDFLTQLGYENWNEYKMEERSNIKELYAVQEYVNDSQGRTM